MGLSVDADAHVVSACRLAPGTELPAVDAATFHPGAIDRIGAQLRRRGGYVLVGAAMGTVLGAATSVGAGKGLITGSASGIVAEALRVRLAGHAPHYAAVPLAGAATDEQLRVMEFNVHGGMGGPNKFFATPRTLAHLADTIRRESPDIVVLQELDRFAVRSNFTDTLGQLVKRLRPDGAVMTPAIDKGTGRLEGTGILTFNGAVITDARGLRIGDALGDGAVRRLRATIDAWSGVATAKLGRRRLPFGGAIEYQPRVTTDAMIRTAAGNNIRVLSGHFSPPHHGIDEPRRQVDPVAQAIGSWDGPTILGADFNVRDGSPEFVREHDVFAAAGLREATAGAPPNSDRIYASAHFTAEDPRKLVTPEGAVSASDHAPVVVDLTLRV